MDELKQDLDDLNNSIHELENRIETAKTEAENNIKPLKEELAQVKQDKTRFAAKNDSDSVQNCIRKENNFKFKINAQWNECSILNDELFKLNRKKQELERQIKLEEDKIKRNNEILAQMNEVLENYRNTQDLKQAAIDSKINPNTVEQWFEWGKNNFNETYSYFYNKITEIDNYFKDLKAQKLKKQMDDVIEAYRKTNSLDKAAKMANVSYDTVQYWYEWGSRGFGEENTYFFKKLNL
ncbi:hypothetical protein [uncultured Methanobrevibacter sp.]|uniref:hypothetical protein n=1 Tax=uncultured Methanobrevibacter sp. TaxID=253161 RepID=UPI002608B50B|nr:hypothetical protein [uncultured Methanobrevibacter sp.]